MGGQTGGWWARPMTATRTGHLAGGNREHSAPERWALLGFACGGESRLQMRCGAVLNNCCEPSRTTVFGSDPSFTAPGFRECFSSDIRLLRLLSSLGAAAYRTLKRPGTTMNVVGIFSASRSRRATWSPSRSARGARTLADGHYWRWSGIGGSAAARGARALIDAGATALISWGMAGDSIRRSPPGRIPAERVISRDGALS